MDNQENAMKTTKAVQDNVDVRSAAISLRRAGVSPDVISDALKVPKRTIAAWLAHDTSGTYKK
jgi:hypothetical protein